MMTGVAGFSDKVFTYSHVRPWHGIDNDCFEKYEGSEGPKGKSLPYKSVQPRHWVDFIFNRLDFSV